MFEQTGELDLRNLITHAGSCAHASLICLGQGALSVRKYGQKNERAYLGWVSNYFSLALSIQFICFLFN